MQKIWPFSLNFLYFAGVAFTLPFIVLYYQSLELSGAQIGLLMGLTPLLNLISAPLWTRFADVTQKHKLLMGIAMLGVAVMIFLLPFFPDIVLTVLIVVILTICFAPVIAFTDSATMFMLEGQKEMYGWIRIGGTFGFGVAGIIAGALIENYGLKVAFWSGSMLFFLAFLTSQKMTYPSGSAAAGSNGGIGLLLRDPRWILFLILAFAGGLCLTALNNYLFSYMAELGASKQSMGYALTLGTVSEAVFFIFGNLIIKKFKPYILLLVALLLSGLRLLALAAFNTPEMVLLIQLIGGLSFPAMWMAGVAYADANTQPGMSATAQGLFGAMVFGFGSAVGGFMGGLLLDSLGGRGMFLVFGATVLVIILIVALIQARIEAQPQALVAEINPLKELEG